VYFLKGPGKKSNFFVHQELTLCDEFKFSPLHLWIPLIDIGIENGPVCLMEKSHRIDAPYRGMSFDDPTHNVHQVAQEYLEPVEMQAGEVLIFDPRLVHSSLPNLSDTTRPAVVCVVVPKELEVVICYKEKAEAAKVELIREPEDFFLTSNHFIEASKSRPQMGESLGFVDYHPFTYTTQQFHKLCDEFGIKKKNKMPDLDDEDCIMHRDARSKEKKSLFEKIVMTLNSIINN